MRGNSKFISLILAISIFTAITYSNPITITNDNEADKQNAVLITVGIVAAITIIGAVIWFVAKKPKMKSTTLKFKKEKLEIDICQNKIVTFKGTYCFSNKNKEANHFRLFYPISTSRDNGMYEFKSISVEGVESFQIAQGEYNKYKGVTIDFAGKMQEEILMHLEYIQSVHDNSFEYLLTTTRSWKEPLDSASILLSLSKGIDITDCNYKLENNNVSLTKNEYYFSRTAFYPSKELRLSWADSQ
jgi:hypothetical protein